jgi:uncharacterized protein
MLEATNPSNRAKATSPNYSVLVQFLIAPFLESPESLKIDCEQSNHNQRVWIRLAFEGSDKGRVYGRGGRNLQAIRAVLGMAAAKVGQSLYLDIYDSQDERPKRRDSRDNGDSMRRERDGGTRRTRDRRPHSPRFTGQSRF